MDPPPKQKKIGFNNNSLVLFVFGLGHDFAKLIEPGFKPK